MNRETGQMKTMEKKSRSPEFSLTLRNTINLKLTISRWSPVGMWYHPVRVSIVYDSYNIMFVDYGTIVITDRARLVKYSIGTTITRWR